MKNSSQPPTNLYLISDRLLLVSFGLSLLVNIILWVIVLSKFGYTKQLLPLHFNVIYGIDFVGPERAIFQIPLIGFIIFFLNAFLGQLCYEQGKLFSYFLGFGSLVVQIILGIAIFALVVLNR